MTDCTALGDASADIKRAAAECRSVCRPTAGRLSAPTRTPQVHVSVAIPQRSALRSARQQGLRVDLDAFEVEFESLAKRRRDWQNANGMRFGRAEHELPRLLQSKAFRLKLAVGLLAAAVLLAVFCGEEVSHDRKG